MPQYNKKFLYSEDFQWVISSNDLGILVTKMAGFVHLIAAFTLDFKEKKEIPLIYESCQTKE